MNQGNLAETPGWRTCHANPDRQTNNETVTPDGGVGDPGTLSPKLHGPAKLDPADRCHKSSGADTLGRLALGALS